MEVSKENKENSGSSTSFTHIDENNTPTMVDVGSKQVTKRTACARAVLFLPKEISSQIQDGDLQELKSPKGPVLHTAIIAGTSAVKKTSDLIPFCHPLLISGVKFHMETQKISEEEQQLIIECRVSIEGKTGVEMEALTGASVAALTVYDMCKALSTDMVIEEVRLVEKTGGKRDIHLRNR
jgi:cyclic pyranopterin phosphate synthase